MNQAVSKLIDDCPNLPSMPAIAMQVLEVTEKEDVQLAEIAGVVSKDPALSAKILRTVNSSFYGHTHAIGTINHALVVLGLRSIKTLALGFSLLREFGRTQTRAFDHMAYWKRALHSATAARILAGKTQIVQIESAFLAALLMDMGMLYLDTALGDRYGQVLAMSASHGDLAANETAVFGLNHGDVTDMLAQRWNLPEVLAVPMGFHHRPLEVKQPALRKLTEIVALGSRCADVFAGVDGNPMALADVRKYCVEHFRMNVLDVDGMLCTVAHRASEMAPLFEIRMGSAMENERMLQMAGEKLRSMADSASGIPSEPQLRIAAA